MWDIIYERLNVFMENQYNIMNWNGTWKAKSHKQERIIALATEITHLKSKLNL